MGARSEAFGTFRALTTATTLVGTLNLNTGSAVMLPSFLQAAGTLAGTDTLNVTGPLTWNGGAETGGGITNANGPLVLSGNLSLDNRTLNNSVSATWNPAGGTFAMGNGAVFNNQGGVPFNQQSDGTLGGGIGGANTFNNIGTYFKSAGAGASVVNAAFNNNGTFDIASGALNFTANFTQTAGIASLSGGNLGGGITFNFTGGALVANNGSTITGNLNNAGANVRPGGSPGTLNIAGNYVQGPGGTLFIELGGFSPGTEFDVMAITGTATLDGTLNVQSFGGFAPGPNSSFQAVTATSGTVSHSATVTLNVTDR